MLKNGSVRRISSTDDYQKLVALAPALPRWEITGHAAP